MMCLCLSTSLTFALLTSVATAGALVACVIIGEITVAGVVQQTYILLQNPNYLRNTEKLNAFVGEIALSLICLIAGIVSLISFIFSVMLYDGIKRCQPGKMRAYLGFGVTFTVLASTAACIHMRTYDATISRYVLMGCGSYLGCLAMIWVTYRRILVALALSNVRSE